MNRLTFSFSGAELCALGSGALFWPEHDVLVVSDLHFGKSARQARHGGAQLPPYETRETLFRLDADIASCDPGHVVCLGDSFDAPGDDLWLSEDDQLWIGRLQAGRTWTWIEGNHDPGPVTLGGTHRAELSLGPLVLRHIATPGGSGEVSGHYHPKARLSLRGRGVTRPCFVMDAARLILPAYGAYTGGLFTHSATLSQLMAPEAEAILTGPRPLRLPMPRAAHLSG